jgi:hypothetical protein
VAEWGAANRFPGGARRGETEVGRQLIRIPKGGRIILDPGGTPPV